MTLTAIRDRLHQSQTEVQLSLINSRLIMRTGVNLKEPKADQNADSALVKKVTDALSAMGIAV